MVNNMLDMAKLQSGSFKPNMTFFPADELVAGSIGLLKERLRDFHLDFNPIFPCSMGIKCFWNDFFTISLTMPSNTVRSAVESSWKSQGVLQPSCWPCTIMVPDFRQVIRKNFLIRSAEGKKKAR